MARATVKSTYALDVETVAALERLAGRLKVSKSEALRRAIRAAAREGESAASGVDLLDRLQRSLNLTPARARAWAREAKAERRSASERRETRVR